VWRGCSFTTETQSHRGNTEGRRRGRGRGINHKERKEYKRVLDLFGHFVIFVAIVSGKRKKGMEEKRNFNLI